MLQSHGPPVPQGPGITRRFLQEFFHQQTLQQHERRIRASQQADDDDDDDDNNDIKPNPLDERIRMDDWPTQADLAQQQHTDPYHPSKLVIPEICEKLPLAEAMGEIVEWKEYDMAIENDTPPIKGSRTQAKRLKKTKGESIRRGSSVHSEPRSKLGYEGIGEDSDVSDGESQPRPSRSRTRKTLGASTSKRAPSSSAPKRRRKTPARRASSPEGDELEVPPMIMFDERRSLLVYSY